MAYGTGKQSDKAPTKVRTTFLLSTGAARAAQGAPQLFLASRANVGIQKLRCMLRNVPETDPLQCLPQVRWRDGQPVAFKGEKFIVEKVGEEWDGGSRGKVYTKGKRGKGFV